MPLQEFNLPRTGQTNLAFTGERIASAKSPAYRRHERNPEAKSHWFECEVYRTKGGKFVLYIAYRWAGKLFRESNQDYVTAFDDVQSLRDGLDNFEPTDCVSGYPDGDYWTEKQQTLMTSITEDFDILIELIGTQLSQLAEPERIE